MTGGETGNGVILIDWEEIEREMENGRRMKERINVAVGGREK